MNTREQLNQYLRDLETRLRWMAVSRGAAVAAGVDGLFLETHDNPAKALSDGANALPLAQLPALLARMKALSALVRSWSTS